MGRPIPYDYRKKIITEHEKGKSFSKIANELDYSLSGVKKIWYAYQKSGPSSLVTQYSNCGRKSSYTQQVRDKVSAIKTGKQGACFVYSMYQMKYPKEKPPSIRTLQRWWKADTTQRKRGRPPEKEKKLGLSSLSILGK